MKTAIKQLMAGTPLRILHRLSGVNLVVPFYHIVTDTIVPHTVELFRNKTVAEFRDDLDFFLLHYEAVDLTTLVKFCERPWQLERPLLHLTFDDGLAECRTLIAGILRERGVPATFFLNPEFLDNQGLMYRNKASLLIHILRTQATSDIRRNIAQVLDERGLLGATLEESVRCIGYQAREVLGMLGEICGIEFEEYARTTPVYMTTEQVHSLVEEGFTVGGHGLTHIDFSELTLEQQEGEVAGSVRRVVEQFGQSISSFAFPFGDATLDGRLYDMMRNEGIQISFGTNGFANDDIPWNIQRVSMELESCPGEWRIRREVARAAFGGRGRMRIERKRCEQQSRYA